MEEGVELGFDPTPFLEGIDQVVGQLSNLNKSFSETEKKSVEKSKNVSTGITGMVKKFAPLLIAVGSFKAMMSGIPEIGRTFKIVGSIIQRNLIFPLRQALVPLLQKLLDWVRDNRAMFVRWGTVVANVFRTMVSVVGSLISILKNMWDKLSKSLEDIFGKSISSVTNMANMILFKLTAIAQFVLITLEPVFDLIVKGIATTIHYWKKFADGFSEGFGSMSGVMEDISNLFGRVLNLFDKLLTKSNFLGKSFSTLGIILGGAVKSALLVTIGALDLVIMGVEKAVNRLSYFSAWNNDRYSEMRKLNSEYNKIDREHSKRQEKRVEELKQTFTGAVSSVKKTWSSNKASTTNLKNSKSNTTNLSDNRKISVVINEAESGRATAGEIQKILASDLLESRSRSGGR